jgi:hypothetical protein
MFDITEEDVSAVYERLKDRYTLTLTNTLAVDGGFRVDIPILTACAHDRILWLYAYEGEFVLDVMDSACTMGTHRHPLNTEQAVYGVTAFMEGTETYTMYPLPGRQSST